MQKNGRQLWWQQLNDFKHTIKSAKPFMTKVRRNETKRKSINKKVAFPLPLSHTYFGLHPLLLLMSNYDARWQIQPNIQVNSAERQSIFFLHSSWRCHMCSSVFIYLVYYVINPWDVMAGAIYVFQQNLTFKQTIQDLPRAQYDQRAPRDVQGRHGESCIQG